MFDLQGFLRAFRHAGRGIVEAFRTQQSFRVQTLAGFAVIGAILLLPFTETVSAMLVFVVATVLAFELLNTTVERLANAVQPQHDERIRAVKDFSAGAVLIIAVGAAAAGVLLLL